MKIHPATIIFFKMRNLFLQIALLFLVAVMLQSCYVAQPVPVQQTVVQTVVPPPWAPQYENVQQVQYYYMPDQQIYYDVWNHEYVYLDRGAWVFSPGMPPMYANYDMSSAYVVVLDYHVHEPWRHHEQYYSHYPPYYYHTTYGAVNNEVNAPRGYNENARTPIYERSRNGQSTPNPRNYEAPPPSKYPGGNPIQPRQPVNTEPTQNPNIRQQPVNTEPAPNQNGRQQPVNREQAPVRNENQARPGNQNEPVNRNMQQPTRNENARPGQGNPQQGGRMAEPRMTQPVQYKGKAVGQPVKVQKDMMKPKEPAKPKEPIKPNQEPRR